MAKQLVLQLDVPHTYGTQLTGLGGTHAPAPLQVEVFVHEPPVQVEGDLDLRRKGLGGFDDLDLDVVPVSAQSVGDSVVGEVSRAAAHPQRALPGVVRQEEETGPHRWKGTGGANARRYPAATS